MQFLTPSETNEMIMRLCHFHPISSGSGNSHSHSHSHTPQVNHFAFSKSFIQRFCSTLARVLEREPILVHLNAPVSVCGDIHGNFVSLLRIFHTQQLPSESNKYLFLGDYVDRGNNSLEVVVLLGLLKIQQPSCVYLLAGNHESASIQIDYGFLKECEEQLKPPEFAKAGWALINRVFTQFPISAIINNRIFCTHGGISPHLLEPTASLELINRINRDDLFDMEHPGLLCDLLWADPDDTIHGFAENERGCSFTFGTDVVEQFCEKYNFDFVFRAHQMKNDGYELFGNGKLVTVFSSANYCGENNQCAIVRVNEQLTCDCITFPPLSTQELLHFLTNYNQVGNVSALGQTRPSMRAPSPMPRQRALSHQNLSSSSRNRGGGGASPSLLASATPVAARPMGRSQSVPHQRPSR